MKTRIYAVTVIAPIFASGAQTGVFEKTHLVDATSRSQAERHVGNQYMSTEVADGKTIAKMMAKGATLEQARADEETEQLPLTPPKGTVSDWPLKDVAGVDAAPEELPADKSFEEVAAEGSKK